MILAKGVILENKSKCEIQFVMVLTSKSLLIIHERSRILRIAFKLIR
jgi:hypothetical protein